MFSDAVAEVLRNDAHHVGISLPKVTTKYEHVAHLLQCFNFVATHFHHLFHAEVVAFTLSYLEMVDVADFVWSERYLVRNIQRTTAQGPPNHHPSRQGVLGDIR